MPVITYRDGSEWEVSEVDGFGVGPARTTGEAVLVFKSGAAHLTDPVVPGTLARSTVAELCSHLERALVDSRTPDVPMVIWFDAGEGAALQIVRAGFSSTVVDVVGPSGLGGPLVLTAPFVAPPSGPAGLICTAAPDRVVAWRDYQKRCHPVRRVSGVWQWDRS